jgi:hypothetical protein
VPEEGSIRNWAWLHRVTAHLLRVLFLALHKFQYVESVHCTVRKKAVDGSVFVIIDLENGGQLGEYKQLEVTLRKMEQADASVCFLGSGMGEDKNAKARAVDERNLFQIEYQPDLAGGDGSLDRILKRGRFFAEHQSSLQSKNCEALCYFRIYLERHARSTQYTFGLGCFATGACNPNLEECRTG